MMTINTNAQAQAQENTNAKEENTMKVARTIKPITDADGRFNLDYMIEIRNLKSMIYEAEVKIEKINEESTPLLKEILKEYENFLGGKTHWFAFDKEKYFDKIRKYNGMINNKKAQEEIIKEAKGKLMEYEY